MKVIELLRIGGEMLKMMSTSDIRVSDYQYLDMYRDYEQMRLSKEKYWNIIRELSARYNRSESTVVRVVRRLGKECQSMAPE